MLNHEIMKPNFEAILIVLVYLVLGVIVEKMIIRTIF